MVTKKQYILVVVNLSDDDEENTLQYYRHNLVRLCKIKALPYHSLKKLKYPISSKGILINKVEII